MAATLFERHLAGRDAGPRRLARRSSAVLVAGALAVALAVVGLGTPVAAADTPPATPVADDVVTADPLPTVQINGIVWAQAVAGRWAYAGGNFSSARPAGADPGTSETPRANLVRYDVETGVMDPDWNPGTNGNVLGMAVSPDQSRLYVVGSFTSVAGQNRYRIAAFDTATGALVTSWTPGANASVVDVAVSATTVFVTGAFSNVNNVGRARVAAIDAQTGAVTGFDAVLDGGNGGRAIVVSPDGGKVVVGGSFTSANGSTNPGRGMAALDATTGASLPWAVNATIRNAGDAAAIYSLASDGDSVYGSGYDFGGSVTEDDFEGSFRASWSDGAMVWMEDCHGDTYSVYPFGGSVYVASHTHYCGNIGEFPQTDPWTVYHGLAFSKEPSDRTITPDIYGYRSFTGQPAAALEHWYPTWVTGSASGVGMAGWDITGNDKYLIYGGEFTRVGAVKQQGIVRFAKRGVAPAKVGPTVQGGAYKLTATSVASGQVRVTWPANYDQDSKDLTYQLLRKGTTAPLTTTTLASTYWVRPSSTFTDKGLTPGSVAEYRVRVTDGDGNSTQSDWTPVTVSGAVTSPYAQAVLDSAPTGYWPLSEPSGTTAYDWAGSDDLTLNGPATRGDTGKDVPAGPAATAFASGAYGAGSTPRQGTDTLSVEAWFRTTSTAGGKIVGFGDQPTGDSANYDRHVYLTGDGAVTWGVYPGSTQTVASSPGFNDGQWHHVVATLGGGGMALFVDDREVGARTDVTTAQSYAGVWRVGGDNLSGWPDAGSSGYLTGSVADVAVYDRVLSAQDVDAHWVASGRATTLATDAYGAAVTGLSPTLFWRLDEPSGTAVHDSGAGNVGGTLAGAVTRGAAGALAGNQGLAATFPGSTGAFGASTQQLAAPTTFSVETWFKTTSTAGGRLVSFGNRATGTSSSTTADRSIYMATNGRLKFGVRTTSQQVVASTTAYNDGQWHHAVATESGEGMRLYVDGRLVGQNTVANPPSYNGYWRVGGDTAWEGATYWKGTLDEVAVYPAALTAAQVQSHYDLGRGILPNQAPTAAFTGAPTDLTVALDASGSTDPDGTVATYAWDFGDGTTDTTTTPAATHAYTAAGTYTVTLTVTDDAGATATTTQQVTVAAPPAVVVLARDSFERATTAGWGTADLGGGWTPVGGSASFSVAGGRGLVALSPSWTREARLDGVSSTAASVHVAFSADQASAGGVASVNVLGRRVGSDNYALRVRLETGGVLRLYLVEDQTLLSQYVLPYTYTAGQVLHVRLNVVGTSPTTLAGRVWRDGSPEPADWMVSSSDSTPSLQVAGSTSLLVALSAASTVPNLNLAFDDYSVTAAG